MAAGWRVALLTALAPAACSIVAGCASLPASEPEALTYSGRFTAAISRGAEREAISGRFILTAGSTRTVLDLASPLGNTLARVETDAEGARLTAPRSDGTLESWQGRSADALAESVLGYALPVAGLPDWLAGHAAEGRPAVLTPETGLPTRVEQDGWVIVIEERFEGTSAPRRLTLERTGATLESLRLRLVLDAPEPPGSKAVMSACRRR